MLREKHLIDDSLKIAFRENILIKNILCDVPHHIGEKVPNTIYVWTLNFVDTFYSREDPFRSKVDTIGWYIWVSFNLIDEFYPLNNNIYTIRCDAGCYAFKTLALLTFGVDCCYTLTKNTLNQTHSLLLEL